MTYPSEPMPAPHDRDAAAVLMAIARAYPEAADVAVEACVLGFHAERMERAVHDLARDGLLALRGSDQWSWLPAQHARLTARGVAAVAQLAHLAVERSGRLGRRAAIRSVPVERRHAVVDRRVDPAA